MRKEALVAILVGLFLGLVITFGVYRANKAVKEHGKTSNSSLPVNGSQAPSPLPSPMISLRITEDNLVLTKSKVTVSGTTEPKSVVALLAEGNEALVLADEEGVFSAEVELTSGANEVKVISLLKTGEEQEKTLNLVYSTAKIE